MRWLLLAGLLLAAPTLEATPQQVWRNALQQAAAGRDAQAAELLEGAAGALAGDDPWRARMDTASILLAMRAQRVTIPSRPLTGAHGILARRWLAHHPAPRPANHWLVGTLATLLPGAGHARLGRWRDALTVAVLVWPMIGLTLWAGHRRMGPVTLFFAMITTWLWSGTVFSALSLAHRGDFEQYQAWWRALWHAAGLPGAP